MSHSIAQQPTRPQKRTWQPQPAHTLTPCSCRYELGQKYSAHYDVHGSNEQAQLAIRRGEQGGSRYATMLMYLSGEVAVVVGRWLVVVVVVVVCVCGVGWGGGTRRRRTCHCGIAEQICRTPVPSVAVLSAVQMWRREGRPRSRTGGG